MTQPIRAFAETIKKQIKGKSRDHSDEEDVKLLCMGVDAIADVLVSVAQIERHMDRIASALEEINRPEIQVVESKPIESASGK